MNIIKLIQLICLTIFSIAGVLIAGLLFHFSYPILAIMVITILLISLAIFLRPNAYAFRFMYPGLITFLFFMILPILFTIYIGFTNLSTGHVLAKNDAKKILKNETYISQSAISLSYSILKDINSNQLSIFVDKSLTAKFDFKPGPQTIQLEKGRPDEQHQIPLSKGEVFQLKEKLKSIVWITPSGESLKYFRSNKLIDQRLRFKEIEGEILQDSLTRQNFSPDPVTGYYSNGKENLSPGFYVNTGFKNFVSLFADDKIKNTFLKVMIWTFVWALMTVILTFSLGMTLALIVNNKNLKLKAIYRMLLVIPYSIPFFISILIFRGMLNEDFGIINEVLAVFGAGKIPWLGTPTWAKISCLMVNLWLGFPYMFLVTTGILQSIPVSVYEAASLDGAGKFATFKSITLPMIFSAIGPLLVGSFAFNLNNFVGIYLLTGGGPPMLGSSTPVGETDILISYTYRLAFEGGQGQNFGLASSIALFIFIIIAIITLINFKLSGMMKTKEAR